MKTKYAPLEIYLQNHSVSKNEVSLSFREIEQIIGASLPASAHSYQAWWANQKDVSTRPQAKTWLNAGFVVDSVHLVSNGGSVRFRKKLVITT
jgi:hypothetical protein